jgi:hypothetical protein
MNELLASTKQIAAIFEVSPRAIQQWVHAGMPRVKHGIYNVKECVGWWLSNIYDIKTPGQEETKNAAQIKYWTHKAEGEKIRVEKLSKTLILKSEVNRLWGLRVAVLFALLDQFVNRLPPALEGKNQNQMREVIQAEIDFGKSALTTPGTCYPPIEIKQGEICQDNGKMTKRRRGRPKGSKSKSGTTAKRKSSTDMSMSAAPTDHGDAPNLTKSPSRKSKRSLKKSTSKSKPSTPPLKN